jgi:hypothetical protein
MSGSSSEYPTNKIVDVRLKAARASNVARPFVAALA